MRNLAWILALVILVAGVAWLYSGWVRTSHDAAAESVARVAASKAPPAAADRPVISEEVRRGIEALNAGRYEEARDLLSAVVPVHPDFVIAQRNLAAAHAALGENELAFQALHRAATLDPENPQSHAQLAWGFYRLGEYREAEFSTLRALELAPDDSKLRFNLGLFRLADGRLKDSIDSYHRAIAVDGDRDRVAAALEDVLRLEVERPDSVDVQYTLAFFAGTLGQHDLEAEKLRRCLELDPDGPYADQIRQRLDAAVSASGG